MVDTGLAMASAFSPGSWFGLGLGLRRLVLILLHWARLELLLLRKLVGPVVVHPLVVFSEHLLATDLEYRRGSGMVVQRLVGLAGKILPVVVLSTWLLESPLAALLLVESE
jgi:hypothetical protein